MFGAGFNNVDIEAATQRGIYVTNARGGNAIAVGEFSISLMVSLARLTHRSDAGMKQGIWTPGLGCELYGKTLGIMGLGAIGMETARIAHGGFNMKILACDVFENPLAKERYGVTYVSKEELFEQADFISVHTPLMDSTRGLLNWDLMSRMKQSAYLVNVSRGGIMDEDALLRLIEEGRIAGAALDVYSEEPYTQNAFAKFDNVITTSHIAASSIESVFRISNILTDNIEDVLQGKPPRSNILNPQVVPRLVK